MPQRARAARKVYARRGAGRLLLFAQLGAPLLLPLQGAQQPLCVGCMNVAPGQLSGMCYNSRDGERWGMACMARTSSVPHPCPQTITRV